MTPEQRHDYQAHFCAACHLMADFGGRPAALAMNYDLTFLTLVVSTLAGPLRVEARACTAFPWRRVPVARLPTWGRRVLAALNLALIEAKLEDDCLDEPGWLKRAARWWVSRYRPLCRETLAESGFPWQLIASLPLRQAGVEAVSRDLEELCEPTCEVLGAVVEHAAVLAGRPERAEELQVLGRQLGRYLYVLDAWQDRDEDARRGRFNAGASWSQVAAARAAVERALGWFSLHGLSGPLMSRGGPPRGFAELLCQCCCHGAALAATMPSSAPPSPRKGLECPGCRSAMALRKAGAVEVDFCYECGGLWLDGGELRAIARAGPPIWMLEIRGTGGRVPEGQRFCPRCNQLLEVHECRGVNVDLCMQCEGMFLDHGEFKRLVE